MGRLAESAGREPKGSCVFVVDDDASMRNALKNLLRSAGLNPHLFASAQEFLEASRPDVPSCLILDIRMPGISGLDLQQRLRMTKICIPIIFVTACADDSTVTRAMQAGAVGLFTKPFRDQDLLDAIRLSLDRDRTHRASEKASLRTSDLLSSNGKD